MADNPPEPGKSLKSTFVDVSLDDLNPSLTVKLAVGFSDDLLEAILSTKENTKRLFHYHILLTIF